MEVIEEQGLHLHPVCPQDSCHYNFTPYRIHDVELDIKLRVGIVGDKKNWIGHQKRASDNV